MISSPEAVQFQTNTLGTVLAAHSGALPCFVPGTLKSEVLDYFMRKTGYLCLTTVVLAATVLAQSISTPQGQQDDKVIVGTKLVTLNVIVTDSKGRYVKGLARDQFEVYDNKVKQQIAHFLPMPLQSR